MSDNKKTNLSNGLKYLPIVIIILILIVLSKGNEEKKIEKIQENIKAIENNSGKEEQIDIIYPSLFKDKENISLKSMHGKRYVLMFFATWCGYCMDEYNELLKMKKDLPIYGILWRDDAEEGLALVKHKGNPFINIGLDPYGSISQPFNISVIPQTFIIDEKGEIIFHRVGAFDLNQMTKYFKNR